MSSHYLLVVLRLLCILEGILTAEKSVCFFVQLIGNLCYTLYGHIIYVN